MSIEPISRTFELTSGQIACGADRSYHSLNRMAFAALRQTAVASVEVSGQARDSVRISPTTPSRKIRQRCFNILRILVTSSSYAQVWAAEKAYWSSRSFRQPALERGARDSSGWHQASRILCRLRTTQLHRLESCGMPSSAVCEPIVTALSRRVLVVCLELTPGSR